MLVGNHQATDSKKDICTKIVLESADPYLPDRVEFKHTSLLNIRQDMSSIISDAARGWAGWALAHPQFGVSVNPISTLGAYYAHRITACPPGFENLVASLRML